MEQAAPWGRMINAAVELRRWVRDADADNAADLFVRPMMVGLLR